MLVVGYVCVGMWACGCVCVFVGVCVCGYVGVLGMQVCRV